VPHVPEFHVGGVKFVLIKVNSIALDKHIIQDGVHVLEGFGIFKPGPEDRHDGPSLRRFSGGDFAGATGMIDNTANGTMSGQSRVQGISLLDIVKNFSAHDGVINVALAAICRAC
jgi:hypothetical protein